MSDDELKDRLKMVLVGRLLFEFSSHEDWVLTATRKFTRANESSETTICLDTLGRICSWGKHFMRADEEATYPISVYKIDLED